jgi:tetratricopeptide (TPR) repeat protein
MQTKYRPVACVVKIYNPWKSKVFLERRDAVAAFGIFSVRIQESGATVCRIVNVAASFILLHMVVASCLAQQSVPNRALARSYLVSAQKALTTGDSATAVRKLKQAVLADSNYAEAYLLLGLTEFQRGETAKSIGHYEQALKLQPGSYSGHYNLALAYLREHKLQEGREQLEQAVSVDPKQADAAYDLGVVFLELGQPSSALPHLQRARTLNPRRPDVAFNIVRAELEAGHAQEARAEAQASATHLGSDYQWNAAIGQLFLKNAQPGDAAVYFREATHIHPDDAEIHRQLALAYLASGDPKQVLDMIKDPKTGDDHYLRGSAFYLDHRFVEADQESAQALALAPDDPHVLILRARLLQRAGQQDAALELAQKAVSLAPNWDEPYYVAGVSSYFIRRYPEANQSLAKAVELNPNSAKALFLQSITLANLAKLDQSEQGLRRAIALQPKNARFHCHLGILLMRERKYQQAEESFRKAVELRPDYALSHYELGKLLVQSKQLKAAAEELTQAVANDPSMAAAYYQLAQVHAKLGETQKSERMLAQFQKLHAQENSDSAALADDAKKETESSELP